MEILYNFINRSDDEKNTIELAINNLRKANNDLASKKEIGLTQETYENSEKYYRETITPLLKELQNRTIKNDDVLQNNIDQVLRETVDLIQQPIILSPLSRKEEDLLGLIEEELGLIEEELGLIAGKPDFKKNKQLSPERLQLLNKNLDTQSTLLSEILDKFQKIKNSSIEEKSEIQIEYDFNNTRTEKLKEKLRELNLSCNDKNRLITKKKENLNDDIDQKNDPSQPRKWSKSLGLLKTKHEKKEDLQKGVKKGPSSKPK